MILIKKEVMNKTRRVLFDDAGMVVVGAVGGKCWNHLLTFIWVHCEREMNVFHAYYTDDIEGWIEEI